MSLVNEFGELNLEATQKDVLAKLEAMRVLLASTDDFPAGEVLPDQTGSNSVLTFTFSADVHTIWVYAIDANDDTAAGEVRTDPFGGVPTATLGIPVAFGGGFPIPVITGEVKIYAGDGVRVTVYGNRR